MKFADALTALIDLTHANRVACHIPLPGYEAPSSRDESALGSEQVRIAATVGRDLVDDHFFNDHSLVYGVFDNHREYGLTVSNGPWTFNVYEHRNSDRICINGCPSDEVEAHGPYGGDDKWDVLAEFDWRHYEDAAAALAAALKITRALTDAGLVDINREALKSHIAAAVKSNEYALETTMQSVTVRNGGRKIVPNRYGEHAYRIVNTANYAGMQRPPVQRHDVYDAADNLADMPALINQYAHDPRKLRVIARYLEILSGQMFDMARRGGSVSPSPDYAEMPAVRQPSEGDKLLDELLDAPLLNQHGEITPIRWDLIGKRTPHQL